MPKPTAEEVRHFFDYDESSGFLTWRVARAYKIKPGERAGTKIDKGYRRVFLAGKQYPETHLIWVWMTGEWPTELVDHKNRVRDDNRWDNLRLATPLQNSINSTYAGPGAKNELKGVTRTTWFKLTKADLEAIKKGGDINSLGLKEKITARIMIEGKVVHLGTFPSVDLAHSSYKKAHADYHGEFSPYWKEFNLS